MLTTENKDHFFNAVDSLKRFKRAELKDSKDKSLIEELYTDLLPSEHVFKMCFSDNTTFLIGRKGTGKSTIILKLESEYRKNTSYLPCYIDTKTVFESVKGEYQKIDYLKGKMPEDQLENYLIERAFIKNILKSIGNELNNRAEGFFSKLAGILNASKKTQVKNKISSLLIKIENNQYIKDIELPVITEVSTKISKSNESEIGKGSNSSANLAASADLTSQKLTAGLGISSTDSSRKKTNDGWERNFSTALLKVFQITTIIEEIRVILSELDVKKLVIFLDDFSEVDEKTIKNFVDVVLTPLNNWANDFICFKVAAYPNRIYYGGIDVGKIDTVDLDFYNLYSNYDKSTMESLSMDFTKRLINQRLNHYCKLPFESYFDTSVTSPDEYFDLIFKVSMNVPRIIGYILFYCHQTHISLDKKINKSAIENASEKYYSKVVSKFFDITTHSLMSFSEKASELQQKEILTLFVNKLKLVKKQISSSELSGIIYNKDRNNPFSSHFYFQQNLEHFVRTLELNFFITKYNEMGSKDGNKVSIYGLNYGLCKSENLRWGKPEGTQYRTYFIERPFDFNKEIEDFLKESKRIICLNPSCNKTYPYEELKFLEFNKMLCNECHSPVQVQAFSESISSEILKIDNAKLLPKLELMILHELHKSGEKMLARDIAEELDVSSHIIAKRSEKMDKKALVYRDKAGALIKYSITQNAIDNYFH
ncbi:MarR family transcriptional regulator [Yersinia enterocolitica]|uniref:MarR family transcriptional regulator n=2 Tax=Yersinia TaxID=629 RepID=UPI000505C164|nr:MarR family transcriptional regulator [Yersinia enterocolitica]EKN4112411.1 MarR family transcriptional regulator [Yersinia enterocolitica]EKN4789768.1 MarR family transcriptional regulator [Yersinia enterocolitica]EKN6048177.1 MarR family transcriptional regulator [Yersinia enterocolitica]EKN6354510.1 MarR family transcriptional regulator [Yersinia enterocolitica]KGA75650.1 hypothetical protein DJ60_2576 [Yersinia enterocolitica]